MQDEFLSEAILLTEGIGSSTPRFLDTPLVHEEEDDSELEEPLRSCVYMLKKIQNSLKHSLDTEETVITHYKAYAEKMRTQEIIMRRIEVENEMLKEEREELQSELAENSESSSGIQIKKLTKELEQSLKENKALKMQQHKMQEDAQKIKSMHEELRLSNDELITEYRQARSQQEQIMKSPN